MLLAQPKSPQQGVELAEALLAALAHPFELGGELARIGASVGIADAEPGQREAEALLRHADRAMYAAKAAGRGQWRRWPAGDVQPAPRLAQH